MSDTPSARPPLVPAARPSGRRPLGRAARAAAALAAVTVLGACEFPTAPPRFETRLAIPAEETSMSVDELLPSTVRVVDGIFSVDLPETSFSETLGGMCSACSILNGLTVPKPGFTATITGSVSMPSEVAAIEVVDGALTLAITNNLGFDPIRPSSTARGSLTAELIEGGAVLASVVIAGSQTAFASGTTVTRTLDVAPATVDDDITVRLVLDSPAGDPVVVNTSRGIAVAVTNGSVEASEVRVAVADKSVSFAAAELDLQDIDAEFRERVLGATLVADIDNPFEVTGQLQLRFSGANVDIRKTVAVPAGQSSPRIELSTAEIQSMLGQVITVSGTGTLSAASGIVTVRPGQTLTIDTRLDLVLEIGGTNEE